MSLEDLARALRADGRDFDEVIARLEGEGASIVDCLKIIRAVEGIALGQARTIVDQSSAWASHREGSRRLRSVMADEARRTDATAAGYETRSGPGGASTRSGVGAK
jgi:hypothetical protein